MGYKVLYNPALLINEMILFGDTLLNISVYVTYQRIMAFKEKRWHGLTTRNPTDMIGGTR